MSQNNPNENTDSMRVAKVLSCLENLGPKAYQDTIEGKNVDLKLKPLENGKENENNTTTCILERETNMSCHLPDRDLELHKITKKKIVEEKNLVNSTRGVTCIKENKSLHRNSDDKEREIDNRENDEVNKNIPISQVPGNPRWKIPFSPQGPSRLRFSSVQIGNNKFKQLVDNLDEKIVARKPANDGSTIRAKALGQKIENIRWYGKILLELDKLSLSTTVLGRCASWAIIDYMLEKKFKESNISKDEDKEELKIALLEAFPKQLMHADGVVTVDINHRMRFCYNVVIGNRILLKADFWQTSGVSHNLQSSIKQNEDETELTKWYGHLLEVVDALTIGRDKSSIEQSELKLRKLLSDKCHFYYLQSNDLLHDMVEVREFSSFGVHDLVNRQIGVSIVSKDNLTDFLLTSSHSESSEDSDSESYSYTSDESTDHPPENNESTSARMIEVYAPGYEKKDRDVISQLRNFKNEDQICASNSKAVSVDKNFDYTLGKPTVEKKTSITISVPPEAISQDWWKSLSAIEQTKIKSAWMREVKSYQFTGKEKLQALNTINKVLHSEGGDKLQLRDVVDEEVQKQTRYYASMPIYPESDYFKYDVVRKPNLGDPE